MFGLHPGWGSKELYGSQLSPLNSTNSYRLWSPAEKLSDVKYPGYAEYSSDPLGTFAGTMWSSYRRRQTCMFPRAFSGPEFFETSTLQACFEEDRLIDTAVTEPASNKGSTSMSFCGRFHISLISAKRSDDMLQRFIIESARVC